jgi:O-antigen ligase/polysaccharide polymerase Wzy-like membrane protein
MTASRIAFPPGLRVLVVVGGIAALVLGACGITVRAFFSQTSDVKYWVSVIAPLIAVLVALAADPLRPLFSLAVVVAPFTYVTTVGGVTLSPLVVVLAATLTVAALSLDVVPRGTATGVGVLAALALLAVPVGLGRDPARYAMWLAVLVGCGWLAFRLAQEPGGLPFVLLLVVGAASVQAVLAIWSWKTGERLDLYDVSGQSALSSQDFFTFARENRPSAALPDPISLGNVLALACPLILGLANEARSRLAALALVGVGGLIGFALTLTLSRMSWIGAAVGVVVTLVLLPQRARLRSVVVVACLLALVVQLAIAVRGPALEERFLSIKAPTSRITRTGGEDELRVGLWRAAIDVAKDEPVFGTGYGNLVPELAKRTAGVAPGGHAHSVYLQFLAEAGIAGALALLAVVAGVISDLGKGLRRQRDGDVRLLAAGMAGSVACVLVVWLTDDSVRYTQVGAIIAVLFGAAAAQRTLGRASP